MSVHVALYDEAPWPGQLHKTLYQIYTGVFFLDELYLAQHSKFYAVPSSINYRS